MHFTKKMPGIVTGVLTLLLVAVPAYADQCDDLIKMDGLFTQAKRD